MGLPSGDVVGFLATLSSLGFVVFFGLPALTSVAWDIIVRSRDIDRVTKFYVRFIGGFAGQKAIATFIALSMLSIFSGILSIIYCMTSIEWLLSLALFIELITMGAAFATVFIIYIRAHFVSVEEIKKVMGYAE